MKKNLIQIFTIMSFAVLSISFSQAQNWSTSGNAGTNPNTNYIGTSDFTDLKIKTNNVTRVKIKNNGNIAIGDFVPNFKLDVLGSCNVSAGKAYYIDSKKLLSHPCWNNIFLGYYIAPNNSGKKNVIVGDYAGASNLSGFNNTLIGFKSGFKNTTGNTNQFIGYQCGYSNTTGFNNTFIGDEAGYSNIGGAANVIVGGRAGHANQYGNYNDIFGEAAASNLNGGSRNCYFGQSSGHDNITGSYNMNFGAWCNYITTNSSGNSCFGANAGDYYNNGNENTFIGNSAYANASGYSNSSCLGSHSKITASNQVRLGNSAVTSIGGSAGWTVFSDGRYKLNVKENVPGLEFIKQLRPVTYSLNVTGIESYLHKDEPADPDGNKYELTKEMANALAEKEKIIYTGFIAQEVEATAKSLGFDFSGVDAPKNEKDLYGLRYAEFVVPLVKAVQQLSDANDQLKKDNAAMKESISRMQNYLSQYGMNLKQGNNLSNDVARLEQNNPNPFKENTTIRYYIPENTLNAFIKVFSYNGSELKSIKVTANGYGETIFQAKSFASGIYAYMLIIDGNTVDTRQMVITK